MLDAEWEDRYQQVVVLDDTGNLLIMSGGTGVGNDQTVVQDVWRSTISFNNPTDVARVCGLTVPSCGIGLKCWPGAGTVKATDGSYISCDACPYGAGAGSSGSSANMGLIVALVVFILLFLAAAGAAFFFFRKSKGPAAGGPAQFSTDHFGAMDNTGLMQHTQL